MGLNLIQILHIWPSESINVLLKLFPISFFNLNPPTLLFHPSESPLGEGKRSELQFQLHFRDRWAKLPKQEFPLAQKVPPGYEMLIKRGEDSLFLLLKLLLCSLPSETGGALPSEPPGADRLRVPRPGGVGVQPAPAGTRGHAPLQTPAADLLALVLRQGDDRPVLLLTASPSSTPPSLSRLPWLRYRRLLPCSTCSSHHAPSWHQPKRARFARLPPIIIIIVIITT